MRSRLYPVLAGAVLTMVVMVCAAPARAAAPGTASVVGSTLFFVAGAGAVNKVDFFLSPIDENWHVRDDASPIIAGSGCVQVRVGVPGEVSCAGVTSVHANAGDMHDILGVRETVAASRFNAYSDVPMTLFGGPGDDLISGGTADDRLDGGPGADRMRGEGGYDTVSYADRGRPVAADLDGVTGDDGESGERDTIAADVENLIGGEAADTLGGNSAPNVLTGGDGADRLFGFIGADRLLGGPGLDHLDGGAQDPRVDTCVRGPDGAKTINCEVVVS